MVEYLINLEPYVLYARCLVVIPLWITVKEKLDQIEKIGGQNLC